MKIFTIGFTKKSAKEFFGILKKNGVRKIVDVRLSNKSQLAGFSKAPDLEYFLKELCGIDYYHFEFLAPTDDIRRRYNKKNWGWYVEEYNKLLDERKVSEKLDKSFFEENACFLCSEDSPEKCHRRLLAEYLNKKWGDLEVIHLR